MERKHEHRLKVDIPLNELEESQYRDYLAKTGRKAGPWVRTLILKAISDAEAVTAGKTQIDLEALRGLLEEARR